MCQKLSQSHFIICPNFFNYARHVNVDIVFVSSSQGLLNNQLKNEENRKK